MKNLSNLGRVLTRVEQQIINGGICKACVRIPGSGPMSPEQIKQCEACQGDKTNPTFF